MNEKAISILKELTERYPSLSQAAPEISEAYRILRTCFDSGCKLLLAGNGGSAADCEHIVGELMKGFRKKRPVDKAFLERIAKWDPYPDKELASRLQLGMPAIALTGHAALSTAFSNDVDSDYVFAQQLLGYARPGDVFLGISTSGNSRNVVKAAAVARALGMDVIALTGRDGGRLKALADCCIIVPEEETYKIQELHLPVYHALCLMLEETYFRE